MKFCMFYVGVSLKSEEADYDSDYFQAISDWFFNFFSLFSKLAWLLGDWRDKRVEHSNETI